MMDEKETTTSPELSEDAVPAAAVATTKKPTARERAEARRRRILEKSKDRMSVVSGTKKVEEISNNSNEAATTTTAAADGSVTDANVSGNVQDSTAATTATTATTALAGESEQKESKADGTTTASTTTSTASKGSARLAQMRRRRYKKTTAAATTTTATAATAATATMTESTNPSTESNDAESTNARKEEAKKETPTSNSESTTGKDQEDRKYLGVVKMRRKMLAEKKASEEAQAAKLSSTTTSASSSSSSSTSSKSTINKKKPLISLRPILVELVTIIVLFLVGFDVGVQNHVVISQEVQTIHDTFAIQDNGIGAMKIISGNSPSQRPNDIITQDPFDLIEDVTEDEEFNDAKPIGVTTSSSSMKEPNIDPVFGVDFDELTKGDGIFLSLVRVAVSIHRFLTYLFFTLPMSFISTLFALPKRLFVNPPILFIASVIIRYVGKHVLGGSIPDLDKMLEAEITDNDGMKPKENLAEGIANTDFASMGTNFVKNFAKTNFPKVVLVYTIFSDARSDMLVVFCGFFLGLVLPSDLLGWYDATAAVASVSEEL